MTSIFIVASCAVLLQTVPETDQSPAYLLSLRQASYAYAWSSRFPASRPRSVCLPLFSHESPWPGIELSVRDKKEEIHPIACCFKVAR